MALMMEGMNVVLTARPSLELSFIEATIRMILGMMLFMGMFVRIFSVVTFFVIFAFTIIIPAYLGNYSSEPLSALALLSFAFAVSGAGAWSMDTKMIKRRSFLSKNRDIFLTHLRITVALHIGTSNRFMFDELGIAISVVQLLLALITFSGIAARQVMIMVLIYMLADIAISLVNSFLLEEMMIDLVIAAAAFVYILLGPDKNTILIFFTKNKKST